MTYQAVLFDLDGTLLNTLEDLADSMNAAVARLGFPTHPLEAYNYFVGDGIVNMARRALPEDRRDDATTARCVDLMRQIYTEHWRDKTVPYPGIPDLLDALAARSLRMAILSNKPHDFTVLCVEKLLPSWSFDTVQGVSEAVPPKPDPTGAQAVAARLGLSPEAFLYLGDTNTDMQTANASGMFAVGACWGFRPPEELRANGAQALIETPAQLLDLL